MGWQDDARRTIVSEKHELETFPGYWVKVRKFSIRANDEIQAAIREMQKTIDRKTVFEVAKRFKDHAVEGDTVETLMDKVSTDELIALSDTQSAVASKIIEAKIKNGVAMHNFCDGDIDTRATDKGIEAFAHSILEYQDIANEILMAVEKFNRPLASQTSKTQGMSPSGSTTEASLSTEIYSPTEESQPS
jgi:hypothetical protein